MKKWFSFTLVIAFSISTFAQESINDFKYIIVPAQFEMFNQADKYRLNTLVRYLFKNEGYDVLSDQEEFPSDLVNDKCLALYTEIEKLKGGIFKTKMQILLKNCYGKVVIESKIGESRQKAYKDAYSEAIEDAFTSFKNLNYSYVPPKVEEKTVVNDANGNNRNPDSKTEIVAQSTVMKEKTLVEDDTTTINDKDSILKAIPSSLGFELLNEEGEVVMILLSTSSRDIFIVKGKSAVVFKSPLGNYRYSENDGTSLTEKELNIQF